MTKMKAILAALLCLALPGTASATGGTWCDAEDENVRFHFKAAHSRDGTGAWFGIEGHVETRFGRLPSHLRKFQITDANLTQRWVGPEGVLLQVQKYDADPFAAVMLTVSTKPVDEAVYEGTYELRITAGDGDDAHVVRKGKVSCSGD